MRIRVFNEVTQYVFFLVLGITFSCSVCLAGEGYKEEISSYVEFIKQQNTEPVDYIFGLFEKYDIVVICERLHPEMTQWELIWDVVSDQRFIDDVGNIFTEYGPQNNQRLVDGLMRKKDLSDDELDAEATKILRNASIWPVWQNKNFHDYLKKLYRLNQSLGEGKDINHYFSDVRLNWRTMTSKKYEEFKKTTLRQRDKLMADRIRIKFKRIQAGSESRKKCLVIMNFRHGFQPMKNKMTGKDEVNTAALLFQMFPGKVANVMLNSVCLDEGRDGLVTEVIQAGKWDAAFKALGNPEVGFDMAGSPFAEEHFDMYPAQFVEDDCTYANIFTGFVFYKPLEDHVCIEGVPGLFDGRFREEYLKRAKCISDKYYNEAIEILEKYDQESSRVVDHYTPGYAEKIDMWLQK